MEKAMVGFENLRIENDFDVNVKMTECSITLSIREFTQNY